MATIGELIRHARVKCGLTQHELGEHLGVSLHTVMRWEKSKSTPSAYEILDLAKILEVSASHLLGVDDGRKKSVTESAQDLDQVMRDLASENPDIVIRFHNMRLRWPELTKEEKRAILDGMLYALGKADTELDSRLRREGRKGNV